MSQAFTTYAQARQPADRPGAVPGVGHGPASGLDARRRHAEVLWATVSDHLAGSSKTLAQLDQRVAHVDRTNMAWAAQRAAICARVGDAERRRRVVIADDDQLLSEVIGAVVSCEPTLALVGTADGAWSAVGVVAAEQPDVLILDYELGDAPSSDVIAPLRILSPATFVLLHSARADAHLIGQQMRVDRVVPKEPGAAGLAEALHVLAHEELAVRHSL